MAATVPDHIIIADEQRNYIFECETAHDVMNTEYIFNQNGANDVTKVNPNINGARANHKSIPDQIFQATFLLNIILNTEHLVGPTILH